MNSKEVKASNGSLAWRRVLGQTLLCVALAFSAQAQEPAKTSPEKLENTAKPVEVFAGPKLKSRVVPAYPHDELSQEREGWVVVNFMIDPEGKPYQPTVLDSSGNEVLNKVALKAIGDWRYEPATVDGKPVDAGEVQPFNFSITNREMAAREDFVSVYKRLGKAVDKGDKELADRELARLKAQNLYEDAYAGLVQYRYYLKWGTAEQQLSALNRAVARQGMAKYLPKKLYDEALLGILPLQVRTQHFLSALAAWDALQKSSIDKEVLKRLEPAIEEIKKLQQDDRSYSMPVDMGAHTSWFDYLFKRGFSIQVLEGRVDEVKLRCQKKYVFFRIDPDLKYNVPPQYGACLMEVIGQAGTKFKLTQSS